MLEPELRQPLLQRSARRPAACRAAPRAAPVRKRPRVGGQRSGGSTAAKPGRGRLIAVEYSQPVRLARSWNQKKPTVPGPAWVPTTAPRLVTSFDLGLRAGSRARSPASCSTASCASACAIADRRARAVGGRLLERFARTPRTPSPARAPASPARPPHPRSRGSASRSGGSPSAPCRARSGRPSARNSSVSTVKRIPERSR